MKNENNPPEISLLDLRGDIRKLAARVQSLEDSQVVRTDLSEFLKSKDAASTYATQEAISDMQTASDAAKTYATKDEIPDTSGFLISNDLSGINKSIEDLESKNEALYENLSMKVINHTFHKPGEITLLSESESCSGKIYICMVSDAYGKQYMEYDFKCRLGPSPRNWDYLRTIELKEQLTPIHKGFNAWCKLDGNTIKLYQYGTAERTLPHKVTIRIIGWANE